MRFYLFILQASLSDIINPVITQIYFRQYMRTKKVSTRYEYVEHVKSLAKWLIQEKKNSESINYKDRIGIVSCNYADFELFLSTLKALRQEFIAIRDEGDNSEICIDVDSMLLKREKCIESITTLMEQCFDAWFADILPKRAVKWHIDCILASVPSIFGFKRPEIGFNITIAEMKNAQRASVVGYALCRAC